jgi:hypothetical protein
MRPVSVFVAVLQNQLVLSHRKQWCVDVRADAIRVPLHAEPSPGQPPINGALIYSPRKKLSTSCFSDSCRALNLAITLFASEGGNCLAP